MKSYFCFCVLIENLAMIWTSIEDSIVAQWPRRVEVQQKLNIASYSWSIKLKWTNKNPCFDPWSHSWLWAPKCPWGWPRSSRIDNPKVRLFLLVHDYCSGVNCFRWSSGTSNQKRFDQTHQERSRCLTMWDKQPDHVAYRVYFRCQCVWLYSLWTWGYLCFTG